MSVETSPAVIAALLDIRAGSGSIQRLAEALESQEALATAAAPGDLGRYLQALDDAVAEKGIGKVGWDDVQAARPIGRTNDAGDFVPCVFTDSSLPREFAVASGAVEPDQNVVHEEGPPGRTLLRCLGVGIGGIVFDPGAEHEHELGRGDVARLAALLTREAFAELDELWLITRGGKPVAQPMKGGGRQAVVYTSAETAAAACERLRSKAPDIGSVGRPAASIVSDCVERNLERILVDPMTPVARWYDRADMEAMLELRGGGSADAAGPAQAEAAGADEPVAEATGQAEASRPPDPALQPVSPGEGAAAGAGSAVGEPGPEARDSSRNGPAAVRPTLDEASSYERFHELRGMLERKEGEMWEFLEPAGFDIGFHVAEYPERVDGFIWPRSDDYPEQGKTLVHGYVLERVAREVFGSLAEAEPRLHRLTGIEALRWAYASPAGVNEVWIDNYHGTQGYFSLPIFWLLNLVCPLFYPVEDLSAIRSVGIAEVGALPGARGLKPEVVRALAQGWRQLLAFRPESDGDAPTVEHDGRRYVPVFSTTNRALDYDGLDPGAGVPQAVTESPFARWIVESRGCAGVVLDPGSEHPLALGHAELMGLHFRAEQPEGPPDPAGLVAAIGQMHRARQIPDEMAGRMLAEWPRFYVCMTETGPDGQVQVMTIPNRDCCAIFTSAERAQAAIAGYSDHQSVAGMRPVPFVHQWRHYFLDGLHERFSEGAWIDPEPAESSARMMMREMVGDGGMHLLDQQQSSQGIEVNEAMARGLTAAVHEKLRPRVPDFAAADPAS